MAYRSNYRKTPKLTQNKTTLKSELQSLQEELQELQTRSVPRRQNNFADLEQFFTNKFILIGGCVLIGLGIGYLLFSNSKRRC